jgi:hypothetical protein
VEMAPNVAKDDSEAHGCSSLESLPCVAASGFAASCGVDSGWGVPIGGEEDSCCRWPPCLLFKLGELSLVLELLGWLLSPHGSFTENKELERPRLERGAVLPSAPDCEFDGLESTEAERLKEASSLLKPRSGSMPVDTVVTL